jgi:hypothetical protein
MNPKELTPFLAALPAEEKAQKIEIGQQYSSADVLDQADKTLNGLAIEGHTALLLDNGFSLKNGERLKVYRDALEQAGGRRDSAQAGKKTTNKAYQDALKSAKQTRQKAVSIFGSTLDDLRKIAGEEAKIASDSVAAVLTNTKSVGSDARSLAGQLEQLQKLIEGNKTIATAAAECGGTKLLVELTKQIQDLRVVSPTNKISRGTPQETERMDLLDGLIIELVRSARKAARSAAKETGQESIATAFELDSLYRVTNQSKANAKQREKAGLIIQAFTTRGIAVSKDIEERLNATRDEALLDKWLSLAASVSSADALFASL